MNCKQSAIIVFSVTALLAYSACTRNEIEFGTIPENNYSHLVYIDSVGIQQSTVITDSFATGGATTLLMGRYKDPFLGIITTRSYFQVGRPSDIPLLPDAAIYDSLTLILKPT